MRSFEERKAEIIRRSQNRINERKKNYQRMIVSVSLCLMFSVCVILPKFISDGKNAFKDEISVLNNIAYILVESTHNSDSSYCFKIDQTSVITKVYENIDLAFKYHEHFHNQFIESEKNPNHSEDIKDPYNLIKNQSYTITLIFQDKTNKTYILNNNILYDNSLNICIKLNNEQLDSLKQSIGINK